MAFPTAQQLKERRQRLKDFGAKPTGKTVKARFLPKKVERDYHKAIRKRVKIIADRVKSMLVPYIPDVVETYAYETGIKDSWNSDLDGLINNIQISVENEAFKESDITADSYLSFTSVNAYNSAFAIEMVDVGLGVKALNLFQENKWLSSVADAYIEQNVNLITSIPGKYFGDLQVLIKQEVQKGTSATGIQQAILESVRFNKTEKVNNFKGFRRINPFNRAALIARDQTGKLMGQLSMLRQTSIGVDKFTWLTANDERVRASHSRLNKKVFTWKDGADGLFPGSDYQCFLGHTPFRSFVPANKLFRRIYTGKLAKIITNNGSVFECTIEHPILRSDFIMTPAHKLNIGDDIAQISQNAFGAFRIGEKDDIKTTFKQAFDFLSMSYKRINSRSIDFHGEEPINKQVDVVSLEAKLWFNEISFINEDSFDLFFTNANAILSFLPCNAEFLSMVSTLGFASNSVVSFASKLFSFFTGEFSHSDEISLRTVSTLNFIFSQNSIDNISANTIFFGKAQNTITFDIFSNDFFLRQLYSVGRLSLVSDNLVSSLSQSERQIMGTDSNFFGNFTDIISNDIKFDSIKEITFFESTIHVYNLENSLHWYTVTEKDTIVNNCRCVGIGVFDDF